MFETLPIIAVILPRHFKTKINIFNVQNLNIVIIEDNEISPYFNILDRHWGDIFS